MRQAARGLCPQRLAHRTRASAALARPVAAHRGGDRRAALAAPAGHLGRAEAAPARVRGWVVVLTAIWLGSLVAALLTIWCARDEDVVWPRRRSKFARGLPPCIPAQRWPCGQR